MALKIHIICCCMTVFLFAACKRDQMDDCFTSTGKLRTKERVLGGFHSIDLNDRVDLVLDHLPATTISVEAGRNLHDQISTEVRDSVLFIRNDNRCNWVRSFKPRITVRVPIEQVHTLIMRGTGNVSATDTIKHEVFRIEQWGAMGTADLTVDVNEVYIGLHTGAGDVIMKGRVHGSANLYSSMLAVIDASQLRASTVDINNSGVGDFHCWAENALYVQIHDVGDVYYRGDPEVFSEITGSGSLIKVE